ncbi:MAG: PA14 domain-containing protein [Anaerolineae bacterium]
MLTRTDKFIDFDWGYGSPAPRIPPDNFSASWTRTVDFEPGTYRFTTTTDDGVRLWVGGQVVIDRWQDQWAQSHSGTIYVPGEVEVHMETYEHSGVAVARLRWTRLGDTPPGAVIVDDGDPGFAKGGAAATWHTAAGGHGGDLLWTWNNDRVRPDYNWARWYPELAPGLYEVFVHVPEHHATTSQARYWISHRDGLTLRVVDQAANRGKWVSLGIYRFKGTRQDYLSLADVTFEPYLAQKIAFDAARWERR